MQDAILYHPKPKGLNNFKEKVFNNEGESIHATLINEGHEKAIIYFGGNAEDVDYNYLQFAMTFKKHTVYLVQYRGYLNSTGKPTEKNLYSDALYIYDQIKNDYEDISLIGRSIGSAIAAYLASKREIEKLVLVTPFDSIENVAQQKFKIFPISLILRDKYDTLSSVKDIDAKTLIIYAQNDKTIDYERTDKLIKKFPKSKVNVKILNNETHNSIFGNMNYYLYMKNFIY
jgi:esterase/lipase